MKKPGWMQDLEADGWTVIRTKSYRAAQERQRIAQVLKDAAERDAERAREWAREECLEQRYLRDRCTYLYGLAAAHGATKDELCGYFDHASWMAARQS
jgi:hypothetical protein